jgi:hypothetical protein
LAQTDAPAKPFIEKGIITEAEFPSKIAEELRRAEKARRNSFRRGSLGRLRKTAEVNDIFAGETRTAS